MVFPSGKGVVRGHRWRRGQQLEFTLSKCNHTPCGRPVPGDAWIAQSAKGSGRACKRHQIQRSIGRPFLHALFNTNTWAGRSSKCHHGQHMGKNHSRGACGFAKESLCSVEESRYGQEPPESSEDVVVAMPCVSISQAPIPVAQFHQFHRTKMFEKQKFYSSCGLL